MRLQYDRDMWEGDDVNCACSGREGCCPMKIEVGSRRTKTSHHSGLQTGGENRSSVGVLKCDGIDSVSSSPQSHETLLIKASVMAVQGVSNTQRLSASVPQETESLHANHAQSLNTQRQLSRKSIPVPHVSPPCPSDFPSRTLQQQIPATFLVAAGRATHHARGEASPQMSNENKPPSFLNTSSLLSPTVTTESGQGRLSCRVGGSSAAASSIEVSVRHACHGTVSTNHTASPSPARGASAVRISDAVDFNAFRDKGSRQAAPSKCLTSTDKQTASLSLDGTASSLHPQPSPHCPSAYATKTSDILSDLLLVPCSSFSSAHDADNKEQALSDVTHADDQLLSCLSELPSRRSPRMSNSTDAPHSFALQPLLTQVHTQRAQTTLRPSVYTDLHITPEGMSGRRALLAGRRLHQGSCVSPRLSSTKASEMVTDAEDKGPNSQEWSMRSCAGTPLLNLAASQNPSRLIPYSKDSPRGYPRVTREDSCELPAYFSSRMTHPPRVASSCDESPKVSFTTPCADICKDARLGTAGGGSLDPNPGQREHIPPCANDGDNVSKAGRASLSVASDSTDFEAVLSDTMPYGRCFMLNMLVTWGDAHEVGLCGLELFDDTGERLMPRLASVAATTAALSQTALLSTDTVTLLASSPDGFVRAFATYPATEAEVAEANATVAAVNGNCAQDFPIKNAASHDLRRQLRTLICPHSLNTHDEAHMFAVPYTAGKQHVIGFLFEDPVRLSVMRLHNYAGRGRTHTTKGVRLAEAWMDNRMVFRGEVRAHSGELCREGSGEGVEGSAGLVQGYSFAKASSAPFPASSSPSYGLQNCENVLWTTDTAVLARVMAHGPPSMTSPPREASHRDNAHSCSPASALLLGDQSAAPCGAAPEYSIHSHVCDHKPEVCRAPSAPACTARNPRPTTVRFSFTSARQVDVAQEDRRRAFGDGPPCPWEHAAATTPLRGCSSSSRHGGDAGAWMDSMRDMTAHRAPADAVTHPMNREVDCDSVQRDSLETGERRSHRMLRAVLDADRCPRRVTAICLLVLSTWGATQHVGLNGLRLRDASGNVVNSFHLQCTALHYPSGGSSGWTSPRSPRRTSRSTAGVSEYHPHKVRLADEGEAVCTSDAVQCDDACGTASSLAATLPGMLGSGACDEEVFSSCNNRSDFCGARLFPFETAMQLVFIFREPIPSLGFFDISNYSVGDQTCCGVKEARVFFAEEAHGDAAASPSSRPSAELFRHLWFANNTLQSRRALAASRVYEVTPPDGVTFRKAPAFLNAIHFQSYDVSLYGPASQSLQSTLSARVTLRDGHHTASASVAAPAALAVPDPSDSIPEALTRATHQPEVHLTDHFGRYEIASGPGTGCDDCRAESEGCLKSSREKGCVKCRSGAGNQRCGAVAFTMATSLGASINIRSAVAMRRARMLLRERPAWLEEYQPYVTPLLPVGFVCKLRLTVCARDVCADRLRGGERKTSFASQNTDDNKSMSSASEAGAAVPSASTPVIPASESLKAYLKQWLAEPLRACSFVNEHGDVIKPMHREKYRAMVHDDAERRRSITSLEDNKGARADRELARRVPMVVDSMVSVLPDDRHDVVLSACGTSQPQHPLQVNVEIVYVADVPFCISIATLHTPLVVAGSAAWVRQIQVLIDDSLVFSSGEATLRVVHTSAEEGTARAADGGTGGGGGVARDDAGPGSSDILRSLLNDSTRGGAAEVASDSAPWLTNLLPYVTSLKPYIVFTLDPDLLEDLRADAEVPSFSASSPKQTVECERSVKARRFLWRGVRDRSRVSRMMSGATPIPVNDPLISVLPINVIDASVASEKATATASSGLRGASQLSSIEGSQMRLLPRSRSLGYLIAQPVTMPMYTGLRMIDTLGHVNNSKYLEMCELARWHHMSFFGLISVAFRRRTTFVVSDISVTYQREIRPCSTVCLVTRLVLPPSSTSVDRSSSALGEVHLSDKKRIFVEQEIWSRDGRKLHAALTSAAAIIGPVAYDQELTQRYDAEAAAAHESEGNRTRSRTMLNCEHFLADALGLSSVAELRRLFDSVKETETFVSEAGNSAAAAAVEEAVAPNEEIAGRQHITSLTNIWRTLRNRMRRKTLLAPPPSPSTSSNTPRPKERPH